MKRLHTATLAATLLITACGGGGSSYSGDPNPTSGFAISGANAQTTSKAAYEAAIQSGDLAELGDSLGLTAASPGSFAKASGGTQVAGFLVDVLQKIPFGPDEFPCAVSGSVTLSGDIENPLTLTPGDNFLVVSAACNDGLGEVVDGSLSFTVTDFSGDVLTGAYRLSMNAILDDLQVTTAEDTITSNGDASITLDTMTPLFVTASVAGTSMTTDSNTGSETLTNYSTTQTLDIGAIEPLYTLVAMGTLQTTSLSGSVAYSTPLMFESIGQNYPHTGQLLITAASSSARLIAIDDVNVQIEVDSNDDGTVDETINTTWAELTT